MELKILSAPYDKIVFVTGEDTVTCDFYLGKDLIASLDPETCFKMGDSLTITNIKGNLVQK
jgi:hypothetical protein